MAFKWQGNKTGPEVELSPLEKEIASQASSCNTNYASYNPQCPSPPRGEIEALSKAQFGDVVYLDSNATHPVLPEVARAIYDFWMAHTGNGSSDHAAGKKSRALVERSRIAISNTLKLPEKWRSIFTSGGSEANNLLLKGLAYRSRGLRNHILVSSIDHKCVLETALYLKTKGWIVDQVMSTPSGLVDMDHYNFLLSEKTLLVSIIGVNNETGVIQDVNKLAGLAKSKGAYFHTDLCQLLGKLPSMPTLNYDSIDAMSFSGHKFGTPVGVGWLSIKDLDLIDPLIHGGSQELGKRAGTYNVGLAIGVQQALESLSKAECQHIFYLRSNLEAALSEKGLRILGQESPRVVNTTSVVTGRDSKEVIPILSQKGFFVSAGSACNAWSKSPSHVLTAMGLDEQTARSTLRISLNRFTTKENIDTFLYTLLKLVT